MAYADNDEVIEEAKRIVSHPKTEYGWCDVGDVLTDYLSGAVTAARAVERLHYLEIDYERWRQKHGVR